VRARIALADSLNVPAVRVLSDVGVNAFLERLRALGFVHLTADAAHYALGLEDRLRRSVAFAATPQAARRRLSGKPDTLLVLLCY